MEIERKLIVGRDKILGIRFTCPACEKDIDLTMKQVEEWRQDTKKSPCPSCQPGYNQTGYPVNTKLIPNFRFVEPLLLDAWGKLNLRLVIAAPEGQDESR